MESVEAIAGMTREKESNEYRIGHELDKARLFRFWRACAISRIEAQPVELSL